VSVNSRIHFECRTTNDCLTVRYSIFCLGAEFSSVTVHVEWEWFCAYETKLQRSIENKNRVASTAVLQWMITYIVGSTGYIDIEVFLCIWTETHDFHLHLC